ncbi:hypothetical protein CEQ90_08350 [Lewinellaceae bacterium SD302]|nr:hypothetical protein CEQ90_08350 [Lewinellaceae bacterium SD302]
MRFYLLLPFLLFAFFLNAQDFMLQGWYWDYDKNGCNGYSGPSWASRIQGDAAALGNAGFTYAWLPPLSRASFGACSNGYDPQDLYDLGEYGQGPTGFGSRAEVDAAIAALNGNGIQSVADVVYNHRDGGVGEDNQAVKDYIEQHFTTGKSPFPSDRFRCVLPLGGAYGAGNYYFKISSKTQNYGSSTYKFYSTVRSSNAPYLGSTNESEPNGGGDCGQPGNDVLLNQDMVATLFDFDGCWTDEFHLELDASDFNAAGDILEIYLNNVGGYSDHRIYEIYYQPANGPGFTLNLNDLRYETYTDFTGLPSGQGGMNFENFRPNTANTATTFLSGDYDYPWFFYDVVQAEASTATTYNDWSWWLHNNVGIGGLRMDAVKHFPPAFIGQLLDDMAARGWTPGMVVGEFFDGNAGALANWVNQVNASVNSSQSQVRVFDFSLRNALKEACDNGGYDKRYVFDSSIRDATSLDGFSVVTFLNNHDFRDAGQPVQNDPLLGYAYLLTNNQLGVPCVFYPDFFGTSIPHAPTVNLEDEIAELIQIHKDHIFQSPGVEYLNRFGTSRAANYHIGGAGQGLVYQLAGGVGSETVVVAINFGNGTLKVDQEIGLSTNVNPGAEFTDLTGNAFNPVVTVDNQNRLLLDVPARSYSVYVLSQAALPSELTRFKADLQKSGDVSLSWASASEENLDRYEIEYSVDNGHSFRPVASQKAENHSATYVYDHLATWQKPERLYRLKMIDFDGRQEFSAVVRLTNTATLLAQKIFPNPAKRSFTLTNARPSDGWELFNTLGSRMAAKVAMIGENSLQFELPDLPAGVYFLRNVTGQTHRIVLK